MTVYHLTITTKTQGKIIALLKYSDLGELVFVELRELTDRIGHDALTWLFAALPKTLDSLEDHRKRAGFKYQQIHEDLSFDTFWNLYDYKQGTKSRAEKIWKQLDDATRIIALKKVKEYNFHMTKVSHGKVFPERWLSGKRWENEY